LEDPRLSRMYWALLREWFAKWRRGLWHAAVMRSGMLTVLFLTLMLVGLAFGWHEHRLGQFAQLKRELGKKPVREVTVVRPGGQDVIQLQRSQMLGANSPEFLSATLLPGRGMNMLQITAYLPQKGEVNLLASPTLETAGKLLTGIGADASGAESLAMGAAIEIPWASRISGLPTSDGKSLSTVWHGERFILPTDAKDSYGAGGVMAAGGLLLKRAADSVESNVMPDGGETHTVFHSGDFDGHWPSMTEVTTSVELSGKAIDLRITARNTGTVPEPIGIGWHPRFAILSGRRGQMMLRLPQGLRAEVKDRRTGQLSGRLVPVEGTEYDFSGPDGAQLGALNLDDTFVHLRTELMEDGPVAELRDPASDYGLRLTAMTSTIKAIRVYAPLDGSFISIEPQFNYDDPFGKEWNKDEDTGMVMLQPGQSTQWRMRLEIFSLSSSPSDHL
jgi:aldose 1-epimerase